MRGLCQGLLGSLHCELLLAPSIVSGGLTVSTEWQHGPQVTGGTPSPFQAGPLVQELSNIWLRNDSRKRQQSPPGPRCDSWCRSGPVMNGSGGIMRMAVCSKDCPAGLSSADPCPVPIPPPGFSTRRRRVGASVGWDLSISAELLKIQDPASNSMPSLAERASMPASFTLSSPISSWQMK